MKKLIFTLVMVLVVGTGVKVEGATVWQVAAPADLYSTYNNVGFLSGDIIELTTSGGAYTWETKLSTIPKSFTLRAATGLASKPVVSPLATATLFSVNNSTSLTPNISFDGVEFAGNTTITTFIIAGKTTTGGTFTVNINNCKFRDFPNATILSYANSQTGTVINSFFGDVNVTNSEFIGGISFMTVGNVAYCAPNNLTLSNCYFYGFSGGNVISHNVASIGPTNSVNINHCTFDNCTTTSHREINIGTSTTGAPTIITNSLFANRTTGTGANIWGATVGSSNVRNAVYYTTTPASINTYYPLYLNANNTYYLTANPAITNHVATESSYIRAGTDGHTIGYYGDEATLVTAANTNISGLTLSSASNIIVSGSGSLIADQNTTVKSVVVEAGNKLTINNGVTLTGTITLESSESATATLLDEFATPTVSATIKQYVTEGRNWYMSSPLNAANATVLNRGASVQRYNEATGEWEVASGTLTQGKGYVQVASAGQGSTGTVQFTGTTNSGNVAVALTNNVDGGKGFNLVGNPYPSYLSWSAVAGDNLNTNVTTGAKMPTGTMWYRTINYNDKNAWAATTAYSLNEVIYNGNRFYKVTTAGTSGASGGPTGSGVGISDGGVTWAYDGSVYVFATISASGVASPATVSNLVPPMQAFWVKSTGGTLTFTNDMRSHETVSNKLKAPKSGAVEMPIVRLNVSNGASTDEAVIYANTNASNAFDSFDAPKYFNIAGSNQAELYSQVGSEKLVINALSEITAGTEIAIGFATEKANNFSISASELTNIDANIQVVLKDKQYSSEFDLSGGKVYSFSSGIVNDANRFSLVFKTKGVATNVDSVEKLNAQVFVNAANQITIIAAEKSNYAIYNAVGQLMENGAITSNSQTSNFKHAAGIYVVKVGNNSTRVIIK